MKPRLGYLIIGLLLACTPGDPSTSEDRPPSRFDSVPSVVDATPQDTALPDTVMARDTAGVSQEP